MKVWYQVEVKKRHLYNKCKKGHISVRFIDYGKEDRHESGVAGP